MRTESIVFAIAGTCFGVILGWTLGSQQAPRTAAATAPVAGPSGAGTTQQGALLDEAKVQALTTILNSDPNNAGAAVQLANTYFDGERYDEAITWYETALKNDPKNVDASTDLGVSYYYLNQADKALHQFSYSLQVNPGHTKTLLNQGIVLAFGKQDLAGAATSWRKAADLAPDSPEGQTAKRALDGITAAHPTNGAVVPAAAATPGAAVR